MIRNAIAKIPWRRPLYVALDLIGFKKLVRGEAVMLETADGQQVRVILKDIGWGPMFAAVKGAYDESRER